jgi:hypothetical protein
MIESKREKIMAKIMPGIPKAFTLIKMRTNVMMLRANNERIFEAAKSEPP